MEHHAAPTAAGPKNADRSFIRRSKSYRPKLVLALSCLMTDLQARRDELARRALDAEIEVVEYLDGVDLDALHVFRIAALWVGDIRGFWLTQRPVNDAWWLDRTEKQLEVALDSFRRLKAQADRLAGLSNINTSQALRRE